MSWTNVRQVGGDVEWAQDETTLSSLGLDTRREWAIVRLSALIRHQEYFIGVGEKPILDTAEKLTNMQKQIIRHMHLKVPSNNFITFF